MRIRELRLIRYGKFTDRTLALPARQRDIHLIVGPNEAGKSTVRSAIGDWLFGIPARTPLAFLHPMPELRLAGVIERLAGSAAPAQQLAFERTKGNKNTLRTPEDASLPDAALQPWLGSLQAQAQAFNRMYALDHQTLVEGAAGILSASDDIGRMLFQSAAGVGHLGAALTTLQAEADALWAPRKSGARAYYQALDDYDGAHAQSRQATLRTRDWKARHEELDATQQALDAARKSDSEIRQQLSRLERIRRVRPLLQAWDAARAQRDALLAAGDIPLLADDAAQTLDSAKRQLLVLDADLLRLQQVSLQLQADLQGQAVDQGILALAADITELNERRLQLRAHPMEIVKRRAEIRTQWQQVQELAGGLGWPTESEDALRQRLPAPPVCSRLLRLLAQRTALARELGYARSRYAECQRQCRQARQDLEQLTAGAVDPGLAAAVEQALRLGDHAAAMGQWQQKVAALAQQIDTGLSALGAWRREPQALQAMLVPEPALVQELIDQHRGDAAEARSLRDALDAKAQDMLRLDLELQQLVRDFQPVSLAQVQQARRVRDQAWQALRKAPDQADLVLAFEAHMADADNLADARLDRARHEAERQAKVEHLELQRLELRRQEFRLQTVQTRIDARMARWHALTHDCGLPELALEIAPVWLGQRQAVLDLVQQKADAERQQLIGQESAAQLRQTLCTLLDPQPCADEPAELAECVRRAQARITLADQAQGQRNALEQQLQTGHNSLAALQDAVQSAQDAWALWERSWQAAVLAAGYQAAVPADQVEAEIGVMQHIGQLLDSIRNTRSGHIDTMQADLDDLASSAQSLAQRAAPALAGQRGEDIALAGQRGEDIALELTKRLDQSRQAAAARAQLQSRLEQSHAELAAARHKQLAVQASLAPLRAAAGVDALSALGDAIGRSDQRRNIERKLEDAETALTQADDGLPQAQLRQELAGTDPDALQAQLAQLTGQSAQVVEQIASLSKHYGTQKTAFDAFGGSDLAAQAEARRQEAIAAMGEAVQRYLKLHTATRLLQWSLEKFRATRQGPMLAKASAIFKELTLGSFDRLLVDAQEEKPRLLGIRPDGKPVDLAGMSEGSRDQLYLALRLAALELQIDQGLNMPLVADDLFINFDDRRTAAGLAVLDELSRKMQVIFLTHHDHLVPLARQVLGAQLNVVVL